MRGPDKQIFWTVVLGLSFWLGIWKHEAIVQWWNQSAIRSMLYSVTPGGNHAGRSNDK